jgi:hypothetical protein
MGAKNIHNNCAADTRSPRTLASSSKEDGQRHMTEFILLSPIIGFATGEEKVSPAPALPVGVLTKR